MTPVRAVSEVFDAIQQVKAGASAFCTNFFPVQPKLQAWIDHDELLAARCDGVVFFLRKDRDFCHLYFSAAGEPSLRRQLASLSSLQSERIAIDLVGTQPALATLAGAVEPAGFRHYTRLQRMARAAQSASPQSTVDNAPVVLAVPADRQAVCDLLEVSFDRFADQLPTAYEIEAAIANRQVFLVRCEGRLGALVFFETQGFTSTVRFWVVAEAFRSRRFGSAVLHHYFAAHPSVRRFILWVVSTNQNAVQKYQHFGYAPDGLLDLVLVNHNVQV